MGKDRVQDWSMQPWSIPHKVFFIVITSLEGWPTKAKEAPFPHEVRLTPLDTNPVFQCLWYIY